MNNRTYTVSVNRNLVVPKDQDQKEIPKHLIKYQGFGFKSQRFSSFEALVAAISANETHHGPAFSLSTFDKVPRELGKRDAEHVNLIYGIGIDLDKIKEKTVVIDEKGKKKTKSIARPDLYLKYLPTLQELLSTRLGPFISLVYLTPSCPAGADYVLGRAILFYEIPLTPLQHKEFSEWAYGVLQEDLPKCSKESLAPLDLDGGVDRAMTDTARWWNGLGYGTAPIYTNADVVLPEALVNMGRSAAAESAAVKRYIKGKEKQAAGIDHGALEFSEAAYQMFEVIIKDILTESDDNTYDKVFVWIKSFVKQHTPRLDDAFAEWMEKSPYRLQKSCRGNPYRYLQYADILSGTHVGTFLRAVLEDSPNWEQEYLELTGKQPVFTNSWELQLEELGAPDEQRLSGYAAFIHELTMNLIKP